ncbi:helix-turn-helix transcriptional regulator [Anaeromyxobacter terrae]|uniref:helix-turn-helix transcriptional regulator n=1 Tax=Anaeromyxobacter terrae TaxID=2925406 RepID=UPI002437020F|nr:LuxR C-terminal-related transcriptional regulator [Anaeromyxobacter sp. SG22]
MTVSLPRVVHACYSAGTDESWARGVVEALAPLGPALGVHALRLDRDPAGSSCRAVASSIALPIAVTALIGGAPVGAPLVQGIFTGGRGAELVSARIARTPRAIASALRALCAAFGAADMLLIRGDDGAATTLAIAVPTLKHGELAPRTVRPVVAHLSCALRLRRSLPAALGATRGASGGLAAAMRGEGWAAPRPVEALDAHALWDAFLAGRWSVVDQRQDGARRTLLLRRAPEHDPLALTPRERDVVAHAVRGLSNKEIAYALGIGVTTVATHLRAAGEKLRAPSRRSLIELFAAARDRAPRSAPSSS